jgi:hypothetical protein
MALLRFSCSGTIQIARMEPPSTGIIDPVM